MQVPDAITYDNIFRILIMQFLDAHNFDVRCVKKSCIHIVHPDGRIIPFDTFNMFYRDDKEQAARKTQNRNGALPYERIPPSPSPNPETTSAYASEWPGKSARQRRAFLAGLLACAGQRGTDHPHSFDVFVRVYCGLCFSLFPGYRFIFVGYITTIGVALLVATVCCFVQVGWHTGECLA